MPSNRLTERLAKLERRTPNVEEASERGIAFLEEMLREAEERNGPLLPQTTEDEARSRAFFAWLRAKVEAAE